jgi:hypothetical protein
MIPVRMKAAGAALAATLQLKRAGNGLVRIGELMSAPAPFPHTGPGVTVAVKVHRQGGYIPAGQLYTIGCGSFPVELVGDMPQRVAAYRSGGSFYLKKNRM